MSRGPTARGRPGRRAPYPRDEQGGVVTGARHGAVHLGEIVGAPPNAVQRAIHGTRRGKALQQRAVASGFGVEVKDTAF
jgi:hypothetical protein